MNRRSFLATTGLSVSSLPTLSAGTAAPDTVDTKKILNYKPGMNYRRLGKTDIYLSEITLGGLVSVEPVIHHGIEQGVNLVHIATAYLGGQSIKTLGNVMKTRRNQVYIAVKDNFTDIDAVLKALNTDYIDFLMFQRHDPKAASDPKVRETFEKYKQQGKVRYAGLTSHSEVKEATAAGIRSGMYILTMPALNQPNLEAMTEELREAADKGVGVMAMKSMKGLKGLDLEIAYLKKMLRNPAVTTVLKGIGSFEMFAAYQKALHEPLTAREDRLLYRWAQANRGSNCMMCGECRSVCPDDVDIPTILRCKDYYHDQMGDVQTALASYGEVPAEHRGSSRCESCLQCETACPNGVRIIERLVAARKVFSALA